MCSGFVVAGSPVKCEELPQDLCAFSVSTESKRCVLESTPRADGTTEYQCRTSEVRVEKLADWIETDECVRACGLERESVGISTDALLDQEFTAKLCSPACYQNCPNIVDLYFNLAAAEGKNRVRIRVAPTLFSQPIGRSAVTIPSVLGMHVAEHDVHETGSGDLWKTCDIPYSRPSLSPANELPAGERASLEGRRVGG